MKTGVVALSGYNLRTVLAFCRVLQCNGMVAHLWATGDDDPVRLTAYKDWIYLTRKTPALNVELFLDFVSRVMHEHEYEKVMILPTTEYLNRFLLRHRAMLESRGVIIPLVRNKEYIALSDKYTFSKLCRDYGLRVPDEIIGKVNKLPVVAKPKTYGSDLAVQLRPRLIHTKSELRDYLKSDERSHYYLQEYVAGDSYYLLYYFSKSGDATAFSQRNLMQQSGGGSVIAAVASDIHMESVSSEYINMLKSINFHGLIMIEVKKYEGTYYMIEANPRPWGPIQLVVDAGSDMMERFFCDYGFIFPKVGSVTGKRKKDTCYFWSGGLVREQQLGNVVSFHGYSPIEFYNQYSEFVSQDVYMRSDSLKLYHNEISSGN